MIDPQGAGLVCPGEYLLSIKVANYKSVVGQLLHWAGQDLKGRNGGGAQEPDDRGHGRTKEENGRREKSASGTRKGVTAATADGTKVGDRRRAERKSSGGEDKVGHRMKLETEANFLSLAAMAGE